MNFVSNSTFFGRNGNTNFPYYTSSLTYKGKSGLWASVSGYHLLNVDSTPFINEANLAAGWDFTLSKKVDGSLSYSKFFFASGSPLVKSGTSDLFSGFLGLDWSYLYTTLSGSYISGTTQDFFISFDNSRYFQIDRVFGKKGDLSFEPKFSIVGGTQHFASTYTEKKGKGGSGKGKGAVSTILPSAFKILDYEFRLPMTYSIGSLSVEATWRYIIPVNLVNGDTSQPQSIYSAGVYYVFQ